MGRIREHWVRARQLPGRELEQALIRVGIGSLLAGYVFILDAAGRLPHLTATLVALIVFCYLYVLLVFVHTLWIPRPVAWRPYHNILLDAFSISVIVLAAGPYGFIVPTVFLWVTIGYGYRFGSSHLIVSTVISLVAITVLFFFPQSGTYHTIPMLVFTLAVLAIIPVYFGMFRRRDIALLDISRAVAERANRAEENIRRTLAKELHDTVEQRILTLTVRSRHLLEKIDSLSAVERSARSHVEGIVRDADFAEQAVATLLQELWPEDLEHVGLVPALQSLVQQHSKLRPAIDSRIKVPSTDLALRRSRAIVLYRIVADRFSDALYSSQTTRISVEIEEQGPDSPLLFRIRDDGTGSATNAHAPLVEVVKDRIQALNGRLLLVDDRPGDRILEFSVPRSSPASS